ncbi:FAD/NAD(P)-binding protein [Mariniflexile litorale]|uniref:FAD/NAD(P)-binding protein n=1 Tax=Mariniflexile litorale TaxID=3045158 RepID=A0AAU7EGD3_9FLAO|nr:FAD/NAD(P)-binding protein [Mariniflexile sp. KMM 9835]MDQ8211898.1 FAD/NAD(P)-binding protein [Mariniflexile sp. KMM 9835]
MKNNRLAIIGSGPTAIYLLKHILENANFLYRQIGAITIFEKENMMGLGMPYNPETTDKYNLSNISSEEIPELPESFSGWLRNQNPELLRKFNITHFPIDDSAVYSRLALGAYFHDQYKLLVEKLVSYGFHITELPRHDVKDIVVNKNSNEAEVIVNGSQTYSFIKVVIAVGHKWVETDQPEKGYYASPWPIKKLIPERNEFYNFRVGILGASLSAFDVVTSLAHRHGKFIKTENGLTFNLNEAAAGFKIILHSAEGWLPHLQYEQEEPMREIYRHTNRSEILSLVDANGFLHIETFFEHICRPALIRAFKKDEKYDIINEFKIPDFNFKDFIKLMSEEHEYIDSFLGMEKEMVLALDSIKNNKPIHWMETLDDLMYCLNFHVELLPAEDHLFFRKEIMPFLMNVIAALPLSSANILLAMYHAGCIDLAVGKVEILDGERNKTIIKVTGNNGLEYKNEFKLFINCGGQKNVELENYPFQSMVKLGTVRKARAKFQMAPASKEMKVLIREEKVFLHNNETFLNTGGIDVDATYSVIREDGTVEPKIHDLTFTHTTGCRPYSYGLQACNATSSILVNSWVELNKNNTPAKTSIKTITKLYEENENL